MAVDGFALMRYPLLDGIPAAEAGLSPAQWRELGSAVRRLHDLPPPLEQARTLPCEQFRPSRRELIGALEATQAQDPVARELTAFWHDRRAAIDALVRRADEEGLALRRQVHRHVLCHADLHTWNVVVDGEQRVWIVDWDEALLAPRERDLMFVVGGGIGRDLVRPSDTAAFLEGYGEATVDRRLLAYYRAAWAVQDIAASGEEVLLMPHLAEATRRSALTFFQGLFRPGGIVDLATAG